MLIYPTCHAIYRKPQPPPGASRSTFGGENSTTRGASVCQLRHKHKSEHAAYVLVLDPPPARRQQQSRTGAKLASTWATEREAHLVMYVANTKSRQPKESLIPSCTYVTLFNWPGRVWLHMQQNQTQSASRTQRPRRTSPHPNTRHGTQPRASRLQAAAAAAATSHYIE